MMSIGIYMGWFLKSRVQTTLDDKVSQSDAVYAAKALRFASPLVSLDIEQYKRTAKVIQT